MFKTLWNAVLALAVRRPTAPFVPAQRAQPVAIVIEEVPAVAKPPSAAEVLRQARTAQSRAAVERRPGYLAAALRFKQEIGRYPLRGRSSGWRKTDDVLARELGLPGPGVYTQGWGSLAGAWAAADALAASGDLPAVPTGDPYQSQREANARKVAATLPLYLQAALRFHQQTGRYPASARGDRWREDDRVLAKTLGVPCPSVYRRHWGSLEAAWTAAEAEPGGFPLPSLGEPIVAPGCSRVQLLRVRLPEYLRKAYRFRLQAGHYPRVGNGTSWRAADKALADTLGLPSPKPYLQHWGSLAKAWAAAEAQAATEVELLA